MTATVNTDLHIYFRVLTRRNPAQRKTIIRTKRGGFRGKGVFGVAAGRRDAGMKGSERRRRKRAWRGFGIGKQT